MNNTMAYYYCTGNLSDIEIGPSKIISYDQCKKEKEVGNIVIVNEDSQRLISISPDFVNIKEKKDISITLTYSKIFENNPSKIYLVNKNTEKIANGKYIDIIGINERNITFNINYDFISKIIPGKYYIKLFNANDELENSSSETLLFVDTLSLYEKKQKLFVSNQNNTRIGVIFTNTILLSQISKVTYNDIVLEYKIHNDLNNILIINTTNKVPLYKEGNYTFKIFESGQLNPINYTVETMIKTGSESDILFSHSIYTKSENGNAYIVISVNDDIFSMSYSLNKSEVSTFNNLSQFWTNTFVLEINDEGIFNFSYYKGSNFSQEYHIDKDIYLVQESDFFNENLNNCQVNYCSISSSISQSTSPEFCFKNFILENPSFNGVSDDEIYYGLLSINNLTKIKFSNDNIPLMEESYSNKNYIIQVIRKDKLGEDVLFQKNFIFTDFIYEKNSLIYDNNYLQFNFSSHCQLNYDKFKLDDSERYDCSSSLENSNNYNCKYVIGAEAKSIYNLTYDNIYIDSVSTIKEFLYEVLLNVTNDGQAKYTIKIKNEIYIGINVFTMIIGDNEGKKEDIIFDGDNIIYDSYSASIEVPANKHIKEIYLKSFTLYNGLTIDIDETNKLVYIFDKIHSINTNYLFSNKDLDNVSFSVESEINNIYLINGETKHSAGNKNSCFVNNIEYGLNYLVNYYDNVVLYTIKYGFEKKCQSTNEDKIIFNLYNEDNNLNFGNYQISLNNKINDEKIDTEINYKNVEEIKGLFVYKFEINSPLKEGEYYIEFNGTKLNNDKIIIKNGKSFNRTGEIYTNIQNQNFIIQFNDDLEDDEIINDMIMIIFNDDTKINVVCDLLFDNIKVFGCIISEKITKAGLYKLGYIHQCGQLVTANELLNVKEYKHSIPIKNDYKYDINNENKNLIIQLSNNLNVSYINSITLIKTDSLNEVNINIDNLSGEISSLNLIFPSEIELGNYLIKLKNKDEEYIITPQIIIYDSNFNIKDHYPYINISAFDISNIHVSFDGKYHRNQINKVYLIKDIQNYNGSKIDITEYFHFNIDNNTLTFIPGYININETGQYHIEMKGYQTLFIYYFHLIGMANNLSIQNSIDLTKNNNYLNISNSYSVYFCEIINEIKSDNNLIFKVHFCPKSYLKIGIDHSKEQPKLNDENLLSATITIDYFDNQMILIYLNSIYTEKYNIKNIPKISGESWKTYSINDIDYNGLIRIQKNQTILKYPTIVFPIMKTSSFELNLNINTLIYHYTPHGKIKRSHPILIRDPLNYSNYEYTTFNISNCGEDYIYNISSSSDIKCVTCKDINYIRPYKVKGSYECVSDCGNYYLFKEQKQCYLSCDPSNFNVNKSIFEENKSCVYSCNSNNGYGRENKQSSKCYQCSSKNQYLSDGICITNTSIKWEVNDESNKIDLCENITCGNQSETDSSLIGTCFVKENEAQCLCPPSLKGEKCSTNKINDILSDYGLDNLTDNNGTLKAGNGEDDLIIKSNKNDDDDDEPIINVKSEKAMKNVKEISELVKQPVVVQQMKPVAVKSLFHTVGTTITKMMDGIIDMNSNIIFLFDLATNLVRSTLKIRRIKRLRFLMGIDRFLDEDDYDLDIEEFLNMVNNAGEIYKKITLEEIKNDIFNESSFVINTNEVRGIHYYKWTNNKESFMKFNNILNKKFNNDIYFDFPSAFPKDDKVVFIKIILPDDVYDLLIETNNNTKKSNIIVFNYENGNNIDLSQYENISVYFPININEINYEKYKSYISKNIDIYKPNENVVQKTCYITENFDSDLTQKFRRMEIYENKTFISKDCVYDSINIDTLKVKMVCKFNVEFNYSYSISEQFLDFDIQKVNNLPLKCGIDFSFINKFWENFGFCIYGCLLLITIISCLIYSFLSKKYRNVAVENDMKKIDLAYDMGEALSFCKIVYNNLFELYPLFNVFTVSNLNPFYLNISLFVFNIFIIFGANAIFYPEFLIEKRIFNNDRNKIYYPIIKEYIKILISIGASIIFNFIMKLIIIISVEKKNKLKSYSNLEEKIREDKIHKFHMKFLGKRLIALILMLIISLGLFYYVVSFCMFYKQTQINWILGSIYSLLIEWIILTPINILIISIIQFNEKIDWTHYMKRLFLF